jgi:transposase
MVVACKPTREQKRLAAVSVWKETRCINQTAKIVKREARWVQHWVDRYQDTGSVSDAPRTGRPSTLSASAIRSAQALVLKKQSVRAVTNHIIEQGLAGAGTSHNTIYRSLHTGKNGIESASVIKTPVITPATSAKRLRYARLHKNLRTSWKQVLFVDSKYFYLYNKGTNKVWVPIGTKPTCQVKRHSVGVHVYGGFSFHGKAPLVIASGTSKYRWINPEAPEAKHKGVTAAE